MERSWTGWKRSATNSTSADAIIAIMQENTLAEVWEQAARPAIARTPQNPDGTWSRIDLVFRL